MSGARPSPDLDTLFALAEISPLTLARIWGELVDACHGRHHFGGHTAEIYAYRLLPHDPRRLHGGRVRDEADREAAVRASRTMATILRLFISERAPVIEVDGVRFEGALPPQLHRWHIRVCA